MRTIICKSFDKKVQQDAHEFFKCFINTIEEHAFNIHGYAFPEIFGSYVTKKVTCVRCEEQGEKTSSISNEYFIDFSLPIENSKSFEEALASYFKYDELPNRFCDKCNKEVLGRSQYYIDAMTQILCLTINKFKENGDKIEKILKFQSKINLHKFLLDSSKHDFSSSNYELKCIIKHIGGSVRFGHYITKVKGGDEYLKFDDKNVTNISQSQFMNSD